VAGLSADCDEEWVSEVSPRSSVLAWLRARGGLPVPGGLLVPGAGLEPGAPRELAERAPELAVPPERDVPELAGQARVPAVQQELRDA
jgi:hypothetical protein